MRDLNKNFNLAKKNQININNQSDINNLLLSSFKNRPSITISDKFKDFSTEWEDLEYNDLLNIQYKSWKIEWEWFDIRLLPFFKYQILYRKQSGQIANDKYFVPNISKHFLIEDLYKYYTLKRSRKSQIHYNNITHFSGYSISVAQKLLLTL